MKTFGRLFREVRLSKRFTLKDVAIGVKKSIAYLSDVEHGRKSAPSLELSAEIERVLGITDGHLCAASARERNKLYLPALEARIIELESQVFELRKIIGEIK